MPRRLRKMPVPEIAPIAVGFRKDSQLSQQVLATRAGISIARLRDLELYGAATTDTLNRLARVLGVTVDELTGRKSGNR